MAISLMLFFYLVVPYATYLGVRYSTGSSTIAWIMAILAIPATIVVYTRLFERLRHGTWGSTREFARQAPEASNSDPMG